MPTSSFRAFSLFTSIFALSFAGCGDDGGVPPDGGGTDADGGGVMDGGTATDGGGTGSDGGALDGGAADGGTMIDPALGALIETSCEHVDECGVLMGTVEMCIEETSLTYALILDACPDEMPTLTALLECYVAADCPLDMVCPGEQAALEEVLMRCLGV